MKTISIKVKSVAEKIAAMLYLSSIEKVNCAESIMSDLFKGGDAAYDSVINYPYVYFHSVSNMISASKNSTDITLSFEQMRDYAKVKEEAQTVKVDLGNEVTGTVTKDYITIGRYKFSPDIITKLSDAYNQAIKS